MGLTQITSDGITDATIATADLADQSVTLAKLPHGTSSNDGKFLRANNEQILLLRQYHQLEVQQVLILMMM